MHSLLVRLRSVSVYSTPTGPAVLFLAPVLWTLYSPVQGESAAPPGTPGAASAWGVENYRRLVWYGSGLGVYTLSTAIVAAITVTVTVLLTTLGGYAIVRFSFPVKNVLFMVTLAILMVPHTTLLIPLYILLGWIGLQNSLLGLGLMLAMFQLP